MSDGRINYCRLGGAANLGKIGKEGSEILYAGDITLLEIVQAELESTGKKKTYKEAAIECLSSLAFDSIMSSTPLSGVGPSRRLAFSLRVGRTQRARGRISCGRSGRLIRGRKGQSWDRMVG